MYTYSAISDLLYIPSKTRYVITVKVRSVQKLCIAFFFKTLIYEHFVSAYSVCVGFVYSVIRMVFIIRSYLRVPGHVPVCKTPVSQLLCLVAFEWLQVPTSDVMQACAALSENDAIFES